MKGLRKKKKEKKHAELDSRQNKEALEKRRLEADEKQQYQAKKQKLEHDEKCLRKELNHHKKNLSEVDKKLQNTENPLSPDSKEERSKKNLTIVETINHT